MEVRNIGKAWQLKSSFFYEGGCVPEGFITDGASIPTLAMRLFTHTDMNKMFIGAAVHDWLCQNKASNNRKDATELFVWYCKANGLGDKWYTAWKPWLVYFSVEVFQYLKGWR